MVRTYIIGEIGINHNGDVDTAKSLIDAAVEAGCDAVKFQKRNPDKCVPEHQKNQLRETPWGTMTYLEYKHRIEFNKEQYNEIALYCKEKNMAWSASVWDLDSLHFMMQYKVPLLKIPSALITNKELVKETARWCEYKTIKLVASLGMSTEEEIHSLILNLKDYITRNNVVLMWCNSSYPAPINELNLKVLEKIKYKYNAWYNVDWGYSGHELGIVPTAASIYLGAKYLERHITLDKNMWGTDQKCSLEPNELKQLVTYVRELEEAYGDGIVRVTPSQVPIRKKLRGN